EVHYFVYEPLNPGEDHVYQIALTPPLSRSSVGAVIRCLSGRRSIKGGLRPAECQYRTLVALLAGAGGISAHGKLNDRPGTRTPIHGALRSSENIFRRTTRWLLNPNRAGHWRAG